MGSPDLSKIRSGVGSETSFRVASSHETQQVESLLKQTLQVYSSVNSDESCSAHVRQNLQKAFTYLSRSINSQEPLHEEVKPAEPPKAFVPPPPPLLHGFFSSVTSLFKAKTQSTLVRLPLGPSILSDQQSLEASIF